MVGIGLLKIFSIKLTGLTGWGFFQFNLESNLEFRAGRHTFKAILEKFRATGN